MASTIISATIDGTYPVAGQDNDSQGFRDNFTIIKTGLATATSEMIHRCVAAIKAEEPLPAWSNLSAVWESHWSTRG